ncbi:MAG: serine hydrolase domain-containing protein [Phycisphaerales bacterium]|jgi:CubicO group peptidase (beta-lactamase class C family)|nr:beta-lactamase family protein [Phycisphaeraceae bacterium]
MMQRDMLVRGLLAALVVGSCADLSGRVASAREAPAIPQAPLVPPTAAIGTAGVLDDEARGRLNRLVAKAVVDERFWGALLIAHRGEAIVSRGYGPRLIDAAPGEPGSEPITSSTIFELASISKPFAAIAVLQLVSEGKLSLDEAIEKPLSRILAPANAEPPGPASGITIRHLLSHTSGRDNDSKMPPYLAEDRDQVVRDFMDSASIAPPGERFSYNNHAYIVLAAIIEEVSGQPFEQRIKSSIFDPAGMKSTGFLGDDRLRPRAASRIPGHTQVDHPWAWGYRGCGGIVTSLDDLLAFEKALRTNTLLPAQLSAQMLTGVTPVRRRGQVAPGAEGGELMALGWFVSGYSPARGFEICRRAGHTGGSFGTSAALSWFPDQQVMVVVLSGGRTRASAFFERAEQAVIRELAPRTADIRPPAERKDTTNADRP